MPRDKFVMPDGTPAPRLWVNYSCPACSRNARLDAYDGPPRCAGESVTMGEAHARTFMVAVELAGEI